MLLGAMVDAISEFVELLAQGNYEDAAALASGEDEDSLRDGLAVFADVLEDIGEMPPEGWRGIHLLHAGAENIALADVPVYDKSGRDMEWYLSLRLIPGEGEEWRIWTVRPTN